MWNFDMSVISDGILSATADISLVLDDHYVRLATDYVGTITLNGTQVFSGGFSTLFVSHGVPFGGIFTNWTSVSFSFSDLASSTYTVAIDNNTGGPGDWIAIDFIEIHVETGIKVAIDIKPGSDPNCFNNDGHGVIPVAILGSADFDVTQVDPGTVKLEGLVIEARGKSNKLLAHIEDVNDDGFDDLVVQIEDVDGAFASGSGTATLTGYLFDGTKFEGSDDICVVR